MPSSKADAGVMVLLSTFALAVHAQTIGDYSRAQASALERAMVQAIERPVAGAAVSALDASSSPARALASDPKRLDAQPPATPRSADPVLDVSGTFTSKDRTIVEVSFNGIPHWLSEGDVVPGSSWVVYRIATDRVELMMSTARNGARPGTDARIARRVFRLPSVQ